MSLVYIGLLDQYTIGNHTYHFNNREIHSKNDCMLATFELIIKDKIEGNEEVNIILFAEDTFEFKTIVLQQSNVKKLAGYDQVYRVTMTGSKIKNCKYSYIIVNNGLNKTVNTTHAFFNDSLMFSDAKYLYINYYGELKHQLFLQSVVNQLEYQTVPNIIEIYSSDKYNNHHIDLNIIRFDPYEEIIEEINQFLKTGQLNNNITLDSSYTISNNVEGLLYAIIKRIQDLILAIEQCKYGDREIYTPTNRNILYKDMIPNIIYDIVKTTRVIKTQIKGQEEGNYSRVLSTIEQIHHLFGFIVENEEEEPKKHLYHHYHIHLIHIIRFLTNYQYNSTALVLVCEFLENGNINQIEIYQSLKKLNKYYHFVKCAYKGYQGELFNNNLSVILKEEIEKRYPVWLTYCENLDSNSIEEKIMSSNN